MSAVQLPHMFSTALLLEVSDLIEVADSTGERTTCWEKIQRILLDAKLALEGVQIPSEFVGVSPLNRSRLGVGASEAQVHGRDVLVEGFSFKKAADATPIERPPPPHDAEALELNRNLEDKSMGLIPPIAELNICQWAVRTRTRSAGR